MANVAGAPCPVHDKTNCPVRFLLPSKDGRWVFFYACQTCHEYGMAKSCYAIWDVSEEEMGELLASAPAEMREFYMKHSITVEK
jgi:hypothetical protein